MQLISIENHPELVPERIFQNTNLFDFLGKTTDAITNTLHNWDVVLFLLSSFIIIVGSIIIFICSIKKIFRFQSKMEYKAREEIRKRKMLKHRHLIQQQKSIELEVHELDTEIEQQLLSEEEYDTKIHNDSPNVDDAIFNELPEPPLPEINNQIAEFDIDYSAIDVPDSFDMWPTPPEPIALIEHTNS